MIKYHDNSIEIYDIDYFDLSETLNCGQCFRFEETEQNNFTIIAKNHVLKITVTNGSLICHNIRKQKFDNFWYDYFDLGTNYNDIMEYLFKKDKQFKEIASYSKGIRILKQDKWEALCSFIISQNNNIPRIKGIIDKLCRNFGDEIPNTNYYSFPSAERLARLSCDDLDVIKSGFRAKYILDAAQKVANKEIDLEHIKKLGLQEAKDELLKIKGVGVKVSNCTLLYGFYMLDACPEDVWMKRAKEQLYKGKDFSIFGKYAGVAQQYIFNYIRNVNR